MGTLDDLQSEREAAEQAERDAERAAYLVEKAAQRMAALEADFQAGKTYALQAMADHAEALYAVGAKSEADAFLDSAADLAGSDEQLAPIAAELAAKKAAHDE